MEDLKCLELQSLLRFPGEPSGGVGLFFFLAEFMLEIFSKCQVLLRLQHTVYIYIYAYSIYVQYLQYIYIYIHSIYTHTVYMCIYTYGTPIHPSPKKENGPNKTTSRRTNKTKLPKIPRESTATPPMPPPPPEIAGLIKGLLYNHWFPLIRSAFFGAASISCGVFV